MGEFLWSWASFDDMRLRHKALIETYFHNVLHHHGEPCKRLDLLEQ